MELEKEEQFLITLINDQAQDGTPVEVSARESYGSKTSTVPRSDS